MQKEKDILKWFNGEISSEEIQQLYPNEDFETLQKIGFYSKHLQAPKFDKHKALQAFKHKQTKKTPKVIPLQIKTFLRVAAVLIVFLTASYFIFFNNTKSFSTAVAQTETLQLPDDSEVILNAQSNISFNKKTWKDHRTLNLDGEAFFKVTKGQKFTVQTSVGFVQVLGTQFNVKERDNFFEVTCYEGSVSVTQNSNKTVLTPGKTFRVVNGTVVNVEDLNTNAPSWLLKESSFNNVPLWQVINELQVQYDIVITAKNIDVSVPFTGSFTHTNKNIALQAVTIPLKLSYKINGKNVELYNYEAE